MSEYKPGPWTTKGGHKVIIYEVTKDGVYGRFDCRPYSPLGWTVNGINFELESFDLVPIEKPKRRFEAFVHPDGKLQTFLIGSSDHNYVSNQGCWTRLPEKDFTVYDDTK